MYRPLCPCPACSRHVLLTERACPFCGGRMPDDFPARARPAVTRRLSRAAAFAFGTTLGLGGCSSTTTATDARADIALDTAGDVAADVPRDIPSDDGATAALYGDPPPRDAAVVDDDGAPVTEYGAPPGPDASLDAASDVPRDAAHDAVSDEGGAMFIYGAPPPPEFHDAN